jgi:hypothetical protein
MVGEEMLVPIVLMALGMFGLWLGSDLTVSCSFSLSPFSSLLLLIPLSLATLSLSLASPPSRYREKERGGEIIKRSLVVLCLRFE